MGGDNAWVKQAVGKADPYVGRKGPRWHLLAVLEESFMSQRKPEALKLNCPQAGTRLLADWKVPVYVFRRLLIYFSLTLNLLEWDVLIVSVSSDFESLGEHALST